MEKAENIKKLDTYEPQVLRKAEITRILDSVKNASFNPKETNNSPENTSFKKRTLLDIALESSSSKNSSDGNVSSGDEVKSEEKLEEDKTKSDQNLETEKKLSNENYVNDTSEDNFNELNKQQLIEENNALLEQKIKEAEQIAFEKGKQEGLKEGHEAGVSEARAQSQEGLDGAISVFRIAAETIDNNNHANLDILNDSIQKTIIELTQQSVGFILDSFPEKLVKRIKEFSKIINENLKKISLEINDEDYDIIKEFIQGDDFLASINFIQNKELSRGDMKLNADGIKVEDIMSFRELNLIDELRGPDAETNPVESSADTPAEASETSDPETNPVKKDENE